MGLSHPNRYYASISSNSQSSADHFTHSWLLFPKLAWNGLLDIFEASRLLEMRMFLLYLENLVGRSAYSKKKVIIVILHCGAEVLVSPEAKTCNTQPVTL